MYYHNARNALFRGGKAIKREQMMAVWQEAGERSFNEEGYVLAGPNEENSDGDWKLIQNVAFPEDSTDEASEYDYVDC